MNPPITSNLWRIVSNWSDTWGQWMLVGLWQGIVSALVVGAILWFGRKRLTAPLRHCLLFLLLVKLASPPLPGFPVGVFTWLPLRASAPAKANAIESLPRPSAFLVPESLAMPEQLAPAPAESMRTTDRSVELKSISGTGAGVSSMLASEEQSADRQTNVIAEETSLSKSDAPQPADSGEILNAETFAPSVDAPQVSQSVGAAAFATDHVPWREWLMIAHLLGFLAFVMAVGVGHGRMVYRASRSSYVYAPSRWTEAMRAAVGKLGCYTARLVISPHVEMPCVAGWWRPTIYLPAWADELDDAERNALIAHEMAHVCRWDHWMAPLQSLLVAWLWWNPLAWYVGRLIRRERERCCDDFVLAQECCDRRRYAELLVNTMARTSFVRWTAAWGLYMAESIEPVAERLERIMEPVKRPARVYGWGLVAVALLAAVLLPSVPRAPTPVELDGPNDDADRLSLADDPTSVDRKSDALRVIVRNQSGSPVAGAQAALRYAGKTLTFDGDDQGNVKIALPAPVAEWQFPHLNISWPGFTRAHTVSLKPGEPLPETIEVTLPAMRTVRGRLVDHENRPVTKARICSGFSGGNVLPPMRDWPDGEFAVEVAATEVRFQPSPQSPNVLAVEAPDLAIAVAEVATDAEPLTIRLEPGKPVGGRIVDPRGKPVAGVRLISDFVGPTNPPTLKIETTTDDSGVFWFEHLPTDVAMKFSVMHSHYANLRQQSFTPGKLDHQLTLQPVLVVAGRVVDAVTDEPLGRIVVQQGTAISGRFTWRFKRPIAFFDGQFEMKFPEVPDNTVLRIVADGYQPLVLQPPINQYGKPNQTFELKRAHVISLRVLTGDGQPAKGLVAEVRGQDDHDMLQLVPAVRERRMTMFDAARPIGAEVDDAGRARITSAPDGKQVLTVYDSSATVVYQEDIEVGSALATKEHVVRIVAAPVAAAPARSAPAAARLKAPAGAVKTPAASTAADVGNILVRALRDGKPLAQAQVGLIPKPGFQAKFQGRTGQDGTHLFGGLAPGEYEVQVFDGFISVGGQQLTKLRRNVLVAVEPGKTIEVVGLGGPGATLDGTLLDKEGKPLPAIFTYVTYLGTGPPVGVRGGATAVPFSVRGVEPDEPAPKSTTPATMTVHTDAAGKFLVPELAAGFYQVMFRRGGPNPDFQFHTLFPVTADQPRVASEFRPMTEPPLKPGDRIPRISGTAPEGHDVQVGGLQGKVLLIEFWASWNKPSLIGLTTTKNLRERFARDDFVIIGINLDQEIDDLKNTMRELSIDWQQVHVPADRTGWVLHGFGLQALPERVLVGKDGHLVAAGLDDDELVPAIEAALGK